MVSPRRRQSIWALKEKQDICTGYLAHLCVATRTQGLRREWAEEEVSLLGKRDGLGLLPCQAVLTHTGSAGPRPEGPPPTGPWLRRLLLTRSEWDGLSPAPAPALLSYWPLLERAKHSLGPIPLVSVSQ